MDNIAAKIAENLLKIKAVRLSPGAPFTWTSGIKSPIYCDNRQTLSYPDIRKAIRDGFCQLIKSHFPDANGIAGVATAGIAHGALVAEALELPFCYVRSKPKAHGLGNQIEGRLHPEAKLVVIEDLVSTGGSSLGAIEALRNEGAEIAGLLSIFTYGFPAATQQFQEANIPFFSLSNVEALLEKAVEIEYIQPRDLETIRQWQKDPKNWIPETINS